MTRARSVRWLFGALALLAASWTAASCGARTGDYGNAGSQDGAGGESAGGESAGGESAGGESAGGESAGGSGPCAGAGEACARDEDCCSLDCTDGSCGGVACTPDGGPCASSATCCSALCEAGLCGGPGCSHDECTAGPPLSSTCTPCVAAVCSQQPSCCNAVWDASCVDLAQKSCFLQCACAPDGAMCSVPSDCCSGLCTGGVCTGPCLPNGAPCMLPQECCSNQCNGLCGNGPGCSHDECTVGAALGPNCTPCTALVCAQDPFCCQSQWDPLCVSEAEQLCGLMCTPCLPNGAMCNTAAECCSNSCQGNVCGGGCLPDGAPCMTPMDCCSNQCNAGVCGAGPMCPSDGSPCGNCVAQNCCNELIACFSSPGCAQDLGCFFVCLQFTNDPVFCFNTCIGDPQAFQVMGCVAGNCATQCF